MLSAWVEHGLDPDTFWTKTPRELARIFHGIENRLRRQHNERMTLAYTVAALMRWPAKKRLPKPDKLMAKPKKRDPVSWQDQLAVAELWVAARGGKVIKANGKEN